ncbi:SET and MYND domain-containing protein 4-like [Phymastichus coffea]|uniref:SET and MYND domain-containing protein 4-like n=1 Tax=Phymastichus coffea TaxID=108790 RepID=UPI00273C7825|nr:SET and MYND domain-containing protein 4-like [Phymastichus coffea]XP_058795299.1 SET and MYND domain-containing protein 4-like [Phymastichus coffea]
MEKENNTILSIIDPLHFNGITRKITMSNVKDNKTSEIFRKEANLIFNNQIHDSKSHEKIWKLYSKSVALATENSENLALAHSNRSAILLHMSKYEDSLLDISRAQNITKNTCLHIKLLIRKAKCLHALGSEESNIALNEAESLLDKIEVENLKNIFINDINETKFTLKKPFEPLETFHNYNVSAIKALNKRNKIGDFSLIKIQYDEKHGRHLIAAKDIKPGQIIYIEKPYIHCVNIENIHLYCSHCLTTTWAGIPCNHCSWTMFCSNECKEKAWEQYHSIECTLYSCIKKKLDDSSTHLAVKALSLALKEYGGIENLQAELAEFDKSKDKFKGFKNNNKIETSMFQTMYILSHDVTKFKMQRHKESVALFLDTLIQSTGLLAEDLCGKKTKSYIRKDYLFFLCALFLRLSTVSEINKLEMWNGSYKCPNGSILKSHCCKSDCCSRGVYIAPVTSLINHSCNPNVNICYSNNHKAVIYALQPIKKGEQILRCYQEEFFFIEKSIRKRLLKNIYNFQCECEACLNDWPSLLLKNDIIINPWSSLYLHKEVELGSYYKRIIDSTFIGSAYYIKMIDSLGKDLERTLKDLPQPALMNIDLMRTLSIIFNQLYGIMLFVPSKCNSEIKFV